MTWVEQLIQERTDYTSTTPHQAWDGKRHYWSGMAVEGMPSVDTMQGPKSGHVRLDKATRQEIKDRIAASGNSMANFARIIGINQSTFCKNINGHQSISVDNLNLIKRELARLGV